MKRFGFGKKEDGGSALSLGRKKPQDDANPYAQQNDDDAQSTYSRSTAASSVSYGSGLPSGPRAGLPSGPRGGYGAPPPPYASPQPGPGYANDRFGAPGGYGNNRFQSAASQSYESYQANQSVAVQQSPLRKGGYGGLGEENRDELLNNARPAFVNQQRASQPISDGYGQSALADGSYGGGYREDWVLTEEEKAHQELLDTKLQIKQTRNESLQSSERSLQLIEDMTGIGLKTYNMLGEQNETLSRVEEKGRQAKETIRAGHNNVTNLQRAVGSIWNPANYIGETEKVQQEERDQQMFISNNTEREGIMKDRAENRRGFESGLRSFEQATQRGPGRTASKPDSKFMFHDDDDEEGNAEDAATEEQLNDNIDRMAIGIKGLNVLARATGEVAARGTEIIQRATDQAGDNYNDVHRARLRLGNISK